MTDWKATLNGSSLCGGDCTGDATVDGCLLLPPDGLGVPSLRVEDLSYPQRDGVEHFADWYEPRIITLTGLIGGGGCGCDGSTSVREHARNLTSAWSRQCDDVELVLQTGCGPDDISNLFPNPSFDVNTTGWNAQVSNTLSRDTGTFRSAPASGKVTANLPSITLGLRLANPIDIAEGHTYTFRGYSRAASTSRSFRWSITWEDANGHVFSSTGTPVANSNAGWTLHELVAQAPAGTIQIVAANLTATVNVANAEAHYFDDLSLIDANGSDVNGPFGVRGRPRVAQVTWRKGKRMVGDFLARFDATDQRLYVLGADGTPGSGASCSSISDASAGFVYDSAVNSVNGGVVDSHWPMDFPRILPAPSLPAGYQYAEDVKGSNDAQVRGGYRATTGHAQQGAPISWNLSMSAIVGPAQLVGTALPNPYSSGAMFGWWQQTDGTDLPCGATFSVGTSSVGQDAFGNPSPEIRWAGTNVAMNAAVQAAFGFTNTLRDQPVLIVLTWTGTDLFIYAGHENSLATKLLQTVSVAAFPTPALSAPTLTILGRVSNAMQAINGSPDGEVIVDNLYQYAFPLFSGDPNAVPLANVGDLCGPIQVTLEAANNSTFGDVYIFKEDGSYVGFKGSGIGVDNPSSLDTDQGTARGLFDTTDFTPRITGDPFLQVNPGETLHVFAEAADSVITICFRPSVISA